MKITFSLSSGPVLYIEAPPSELLMNVLSRLLDQNPEIFKLLDIKSCYLNEKEIDMVKSLDYLEIKNGTTIKLNVIEGRKNEYLKYFKDERIKPFVDKFESELEKIKSQNGIDNKKINFELKTGDPKEGISFELFTIEKSELFKYVNMNISYIKNSFSVLTIQFKAKNEEYVKKIKSLYDNFEHNILRTFLNTKMYDLSLNFRNEGTNIFIEVVSQSGRYIKPIISFGLDLTKLGEYSLSMGFRTKLKVSDVFCSSKTCEEIASLFFDFIMYFKAESKNLANIVEAAMNAMNKIDLTSSSFQKRLEDYLKFLSIAMDLISANTEIKATPKYIIKETARSLEYYLPGMKLMAKPFVDTIYQALNIEGIILDSIDICYGFPQKQVGFLFSMRLPGLTSSIEKILKEN